MPDVLVSSQKLLDRLAREELHLKHLGLVNHAAGMRSAITLLIKEVLEAKDPAPPQPIEPLT